MGIKQIHGEDAGLHIVAVTISQAFSIYLIKTLFTL